MERFDAVLFDLFGTLVTERAKAIDGARELLEQLPACRWAVVTSCPTGLAMALLTEAGLPKPGVLVSADDVERNKPAPDCYRLAAERVGVAPEKCLVVEDSRQGIAAGVAAGMTVIAVSKGREFAFQFGDVRPVASLRALQLEIEESGAICLR